MVRTAKQNVFLQAPFNNYCKICRKRIEKNKKRESTAEYFDDLNHGMSLKQEGGLGGGGRDFQLADDPLEFIIDMREYDVPYHMRTAIDMELRVGAWFVVSPQEGSEVCTVAWQKEILELCNLRILAFDIECEKAPLKFPDAEKGDRIFMISYMISGQGYLLINR